MFLFRCDSAADVVETLKMLGSDDAKKKGIGESFEHHETTSSEEDSSSLESCMYTVKRPF